MKLALVDISKRFSHKVVLDKLSLNFDEGQIHALLGQNGAGKSTIANIIYGELPADSGQILIDNSPVHITTAKAAIKMGICYVHQRPVLADSISVKENLLLGTKGITSQQIQAIINQWVPGLSLNTSVKTLSSDTRFYIALCSALLKNPKILILDEPTALLDESQRVDLYSRLQNMANNGMNIIVITHNMDEATKYCQTITYLEKGKVKAYTGSDLEFKNKGDRVNCKQQFQNTPLMSVKNLTARPKNTPALFNINFDVQRGQISLIKGLPEDGLITLENILCGIKLKYTKGTICFTNKDHTKTINLEKDSFNTRILRTLPHTKVGIIPTDSRFRGSNPLLSIKEMMGNTKDLEKLITQATVDIKASEPASNLSGGMLQRLIFARELQEDTDLILLFNPMQGLDVNACFHIAEILKEKAQKGAAILVLSTGAFDQTICQNIYELKAGVLKCTTLD